MKSAIIIITYYCIIAYNHRKLYTVSSLKFNIIYTFYTTIKTKDVCVFVCLCVCHVYAGHPSHWWISFIFYTIIGLDPEGGQWLFKLKSNHKKKNRQNAKQYIWDCSKKWNRKHTNLDTVVGFENEMVSAVQCQNTRHRYTPLNSMELRTVLSLRKSFSQCTKSCACTACKTLSRIHSRVRWFTHVNCFSYARTL